MSKNTSVRNTTRLHRCEHCRGTFYAPKGIRVCPHPECGKKTEVVHGYDGSPAGFFTKYLEGVAVETGCAIEIRNVKRTAEIIEITAQDKAA